MASKTKPAAASAESAIATEAPGHSLVAYLGSADAKDMDRLIYERIRLGIVSALSVNPSLSFSELKALLKTTDGNLSTHARRLENAGYVSCKKSFSGRTPKTVFRLTAAGHKALSRYLAHMEALITATRRR